MKIFNSNELKPGSLYKFPAVRAIKLLVFAAPIIDYSKLLGGLTNEQFFLFLQKSKIAEEMTNLLLKSSNTREWLYVGVNDIFGHVCIPRSTCYFGLEDPTKGQKK